MPSRNSINKPKDNILRGKRNGRLGQKRALTRARGTTGATLLVQASPLSLAHSLYQNKDQLPTDITTQTLSKKRLLKIERNKKYLELRNSKKLDKNDVEMEIEIEEKLNKVTAVRNALWSVVENSANGYFANVPSGNGTTLGEASF